MLRFMKQSRWMEFRMIRFACMLVAVCAAPQRGFGEPATAALNAFNAYASSVEARLEMQRRPGGTFFGGGVLDPATAQRLRRGEVIVEQLPPVSNEPEGAMLHDWRGTAFAPGATAADFERVLRDFGAYPQRFAPEVLQARVLSTRGDELTAWMRVRQKHVLTVVMDSTYDVQFGRRDDARSGWSVSRSTKIAEIGGYGTAKERALDASEEHGFLWRLNSYWTYEERDGGLYIQIESISLSRAIPTGLGWALRPYVESVPRESLEFTLKAACKAVKQEKTR
jgi:hypothetical protein